MILFTGDGTWSEPNSYPPGETVYPATLNKPDHKIMGCGCHPLKLEYDPNSEDGAEFYCENNVDLHNLPAKIGTDTRCHLFCDKVTLPFHNIATTLLTSCRC